MNHWARMLADLPALGQRQIARAQRISLPRGADAATRVLRLREALCHARTVRVTYEALDAPTQAALQDLRTLHGGLAPEELTLRYGAIRSWRQITADPRPYTIAERLLLLGWLLPRPAAPHHPPRYLLPPEVRRWLPTPPVLADAGPTPTAPPSPGLRAAMALLLAGINTPLPICADGTLRRSALRRLAPQLAPLPDDEAIDALAFVAPLLVELGLLAPQQERLMTTPGAWPWLALPPATRLARLTHTWTAMPRPDPWLAPVHVDPRGINWPLLRSRLCAWVDALPIGRLLDPDDLYPALAGAFGPLADAHTHGFRNVDRAPWQPRRAAAVWVAALRSPLRWLGRVVWHTSPAEPERLFRPDPAPVADSPPWRIIEPDMIVVPHVAADIDLLRLALFIEWQSANDQEAIYRLIPTRLADAQPMRPVDARAVFERRAGPLPPAFTTLLDTHTPTVRIYHGAVLLADPPVLARGLQARSVRRYLEAHFAPGLGLVKANHVEPLVRALRRQGIAAQVDAPPALAPATDLSPGACASLLVACAFYLHHAPPDAPLLPLAETEATLRAALSPALQAAVDAALAVYNVPSPTSPPEVPPDHDTVLAELQRALRAQRPVRVRYDSGGNGLWTERLLRPLSLDQRNGCWYLRAFCDARNEERTFRVDRISLLFCDPDAFAPR